MRSLIVCSALGLATIVVATEWTFLDFQSAGLTKRQQSDFFGWNERCGSGDTCQEACGPTRGGTWDRCTANNSNLCFNSTQICCTDGNVCPVGSYCAGGTACCLEGDVPSNCGGYTSVASIVGAEATSAAASQSSSSAPTPPAYATPTSTTPPSAYTSSSTTSYGTVPGEEAVTSTHPHPGQPTVNATTPSWYPPPQQTGGAGRQGEAVQWMLGGLAFLGLSFFL